jgi:peptidoglycan/LPS O-acetylase OafA/YrhL
VTSSASSTTEPGEHVPELDWLKGFAILSVICIHAELFSSSFFFLQVINRAVPIFLVLFGVSSELWWQREARRAPDRVLRNWYGRRLGRLLPGFWLMMALWWLVVFTWRAPPGNLRLGAPQAALSFIGYAPWLGTTWFVTVVLQYVLVFPFVRRATVALGAVASLLLAALATLAGSWYLLNVIDAARSWLGDNVPPPGWYYGWIFGPRLLWDVVAGIFVARLWGGRISARATLVAFALTAVGVYVADVARGGPEDFWGPVRAFTVQHIVDVPLSIALLGFFRWVPLPAAVRRFLAWCGVWSWGIYIGHIFAHDMLELAGQRLRLGEQWVRALYVVFLLAAGAALAVLAERAARLLRQRLSRSAVSSPA